MMLKQNRWRLALRLKEGYKSNLYSNPRLVPVTHSAIQRRMIWIWVRGLQKGKPEKEANVVQVGGGVNGGAGEPTHDCDGGWTEARKRPGWWGCSWDGRGARGK